MPAWIHARAEHILAKNPSMPKSQAFALATQQSHALGKSPKGYGTEQGRETAKAKYKTPGDDKKKANPGNLKSEKMAMDAITMHAFSDELQKIKEAGFLDSVKRIAMTDVGGPKGILQPAGQIAQNAKVKKPGADFAAWQAKRDASMRAGRA